MLALCHKIGCLCLKVLNPCLAITMVTNLCSNVVGKQRIITFVLIDTILPKICICLFKKHDYLLACT